MDSKRLNVGEWIVGASGVLLFVFSLLPWFEAESDFRGSDSANAWQFTLPALAVGLGVLATIYVVMKAAAVVLPPWPWGAVLLGAGGATFALVVIKLVAGVDVPPGFGDVEISPRIGIFLGALAGAGLTVGGFLAFASERSSRA